MLNNGEVKGVFDVSEDITVQVDFTNFKDGNMLYFFMHIIDENENIVFTTANLHSITNGKDPWFDVPYPIGEFITQCNIPSEYLNTGDYSVNFQIQFNILQHVAISGPVLNFKIRDELGSIKELNQEWPGMVRPKLKWTTNKI